MSYYSEVPALPGAGFQVAREIAERADAEIAELRRDAERYRWLRMNRLWLKGKLPMLAAPEFDTAIDSAIDAARGGE